MKKFFLLVSSIFFLAATAFADPPHFIKASYSKNRQEMNIAVEHMVNDPSKHFVKEVILSRGGEVIAKKEFDFQTSRRQQTMPPIKFAAQDGDEISVRAICNVKGEYETKISVKQIQKK
ncbi:MAG TPA: hypothetical protein PKU96_05830 [bacterium]|jgi:desulfoferrodoxin (superoxide reductase-like protein)|nr:hypothetical protein [Myxococcales bacterium]OQA60897.1 MAG: hypothetical protein BWY40_00831 [bacterium ADurb.Bin270]HPW45870.1 hypothetical protein [bacterium]HQC50344.1 hypothetical protein [bacterium]HQG12996.1 hypothetical protein [bacterium]